MSQDPTEQSLLGDERTQLLAFVSEQRAELVGLLDGLSEEQARARVVPSATTLLGIVKHCTFVEQVWFHVALAGRSRAELGLPEDAESSWVLEPDDTVASVASAYRRVCAEADDIVAAHELDDLALHNRRSPLTLRWVHLHLVRELARHAGHGDILREKIFAEAVDSRGPAATDS